MKRTLSLQHALVRVGAALAAVVWAAVFGALLIGGAGPALAAGETARPMPAGAKISEEQAKEIALKTLPGKVTGVTLEKKMGKQVYAVEIMSKTKGEKDVFVDIVSGKVLGID